MAQLRTHVDPASEEGRGNAAAMRTLVDDLRARTRALDKELPRLAPDAAGPGSLVRD